MAIEYVWTEEMLLFVMFFPFHFIIFSAPASINWWTTKRNYCKILTTIIKFLFNKTRSVEKEIDAQLWSIKMEIPNNSYAIRFRSFAWKVCTRGWRHERFWLVSAQSPLSTPINLSILLLSSSSIFFSLLNTIADLFLIPHRFLVFEKWSNIRFSGPSLVGKSAKYLYYNYTWMCLCTCTF